jgi:predicted enzyme related to lactoylglutathione lyase
MPDPFEALRTPIVPIQPDPRFTTDLRARLRRALADPQGAPMTDVTDHTATTETYRHGDIAYVSLWVGDVARAAHFFADVLGWEYVDAPPDRRHLANTTLAHGIFATDGPPTLFLSLAVDDLAAASDLVRAGGGQVGEPTRAPFGLLVECVDPLGTSFSMIELPPEGERRPRPPANGVHHGDVEYVSMSVTDSAAARSFYGSVFGWTFGPGSIDDGFQIESPVPMMGLAGGAERALVQPVYKVDDVAAAARRVRALGGTATEPEVRPYGQMSECTDDQGTAFYLGQSSP